MFDLFAWISKYYIDPIIHDTSYNPVDTITWAIILGLTILVLIKLFRIFGQDVDESACALHHSLHLGRLELESDRRRKSGYGALEVPSHNASHLFFGSCRHCCLSYFCS